MAWGKVTDVRSYPDSLHVPYWSRKPNKEVTITSQVNHLVIMVEELNELVTQHEIALKAIEDGPQPAASAGEGGKGGKGDEGHDGGKGGKGDDKGKGKDKGGKGGKSMRSGWMERCVDLAAVVLAGVGTNAENMVLELVAKHRVFKEGLERAYQREQKAPPQMFLDACKAFEAAQDA